MAPYIFQLLKSQFFVSIPSPTTSFADQTVIVTGSNTGLGKEAARHLLRLNAAKVILAVRTISKGEAAAAELVSSCNVPASRVEVWQLDMGSRDSITAFAKRAAGLERLDAAILNAGVLSMNWSAIDGVESHIAVNVIGALLLQNLLLPILHDSSERTGQRGRLALVGSDMMYIANPADLETSGSILEKLNTQGNVSVSQYYRLSKLLVFYATRRLAAQNTVAKSNVVVTVMTPGACESDILRDDMGMITRTVMRVLKGIIARTTEVGGRTLVHAVNPELPADAHGRFLMDCGIAKNGSGADSKLGQQMESKWNEEIFAHLNEIVPGSSKA